MKCSHPLNSDNHINLSASLRRYVISIDRTCRAHFLKEFLFTLMYVSLCIYMDVFKVYSVTKKSILWYIYQINLFPISFAKNRTENMKIQKKNCTKLLDLNGNYIRCAAKVVVSGREIFDLWNLLCSSHSMKFSYTIQSIKLFMLEINLVLNIYIHTKNLSKYPFFYLYKKDFVLI